MSATDGDLVRICRRIERLSWAIREAMDELEMLDHPNAEECHGALESNGFPVLASAEAIAYDSLIHPDRWVLDYHGWGGPGCLKYERREPKLVPDQTPLRGTRSGEGTAT